MVIKKISIVLIIFSLASILITAQDKKDNKRIIEEIKAHNSDMAIRWTGHNGWLIKYNDILIGTDLNLESDERAVPYPITAEELASELDIAFITHEHGDHFKRKTSKILAEYGNCVFVMPSNSRDIAIEESEIHADRIRVAKHREPFSINKVKIEPIRAINGNPKLSVFYDANLEDCGYLITLGGKRILQMGDTVLLEDHLYLKHVDILLFSPTKHNIHIDPSVILINELEPDYISPQHRAAYKVTHQNRYWTSGYPYEVKFRLSKPLQNNYHILEMGEKRIITYGNS